MEKDEIKNLIKELVEKTTVKLTAISLVEEGPKNIWVSVEVGEPHFFIGHEGEGLHALNHIVQRIIESKSPTREGEERRGLGVLVDVNGFQKKHIDNIRAVAHMMSERARYFKSNIEVDPMSAFERRIIHEFLSDAVDLKTESMGMGRDRRVVIKYVGGI
ncbi:MAG: R3H domain-containing nucleic acid-binding protein [bacterium]